MISIFDLRKTFIFQDLEDDEYEKAIKSTNPVFRQYSRGEMIYSPACNKKLGIVVSGECEILRDTPPDQKILLNTLKSYDSFGILSVFCEEPYSTVVYAKKKCEICFIDSADIISLTGSISKIALNLLQFLAKRAVYLNSRLETVTQITVTSRLASFIIKEAKKQSTELISFNHKRCAESINSGRSSVYRAIENLESQGYIAAEGKQIKIINMEKLEEITK